ncbi:MAG: hypothetical protein ACKVQC_06900 [Elusimicrobiota bacterium]
MNEKEFFSKIDFNKSWDEKDWENFFQAQDDYRLSLQSANIQKKPISKFKFEGTDEVRAFEPVIHAYGFSTNLSVIHELKNQPFVGDHNPDHDYHPATDEDPHYWGEGAPLTTVLIYRDCCRFAICTYFEIDRYLKRKELSYKRKYSAEFESLRFHANWIAINIGQGHRIGYSEDRIQGNIAKSLRAIKHADICMGLINKICLRTKSLRFRKELFSFSVQLRNGLFSWVDELRSRYN